MRRAKVNSAANRRVLQGVNENPPTREQMWAWLAACGKLLKKDRVFEVHAITWAKLFPGHARQGTSAMFRIQALADMVERTPFPGWSDPERKGKRNGANLTREVFFAAAAIEPMVFNRDGEMTFDRESLLKRAFQLAKRN